jgi:hypothetical protein
MKLPGSKRNKEVVGKPLIDQDQKYGGGSSAVYQDHGQYHQSSLWEHEESPSGGKKGMGSLVRKLNCGASKKYDELEMQGVLSTNARNFHHQYPPHQQPTYVSPPVSQRHSQRPRSPTKRQPNKPTRTEENSPFRSVLITVKDGDVQHQELSTNEPTKTVEWKSTYLGNGSRSSPKSKPMKPRYSSPLRTFHNNNKNMKARHSSPRKPPRRVVTPEKRQKSPQRTPKKNCIPLRVKSPGRSVRRAKNMDDIKTEQEIGRKKRWRKGFQRGWKDDTEIGSQSEFGEESTFADSYTEGYSTDTSYDSSYESSRCASSGLGACRGYTNRAQRSSSRKGRKSRQLSKDTSVFDSVAEDLGVMAKLLLSDGTACFSSAAEITRETIVSCKQDY